MGTVLQAKKVLSTETRSPYRPQPEVRGPHAVQLPWTAISALIGIGVVSLLMTIVIAASASGVSGPASPGLAALTSLVRHQGLILRFCQSAWESGYPAHLPASCDDITDPGQFQREHPTMRADEFIWIEFHQGTLNLAELIGWWGRPTLERGRGNQFGLRWSLGAYGLSGWLKWGDPHHTPESAVLTLDAIGGRGVP